MYMILVILLGRVERKQRTKVKMLYHWCFTKHLRYEHLYHSWIYFGPARYWRNIIQHRWMLMEWPTLHLKRPYKKVFTTVCLKEISVCLKHNIPHWLTECIDSKDSHQQRCRLCPGSRWILVSSEGDLRRKVVNNVEIQSYRKVNRVLPINWALPQR